MSKLPSCTDSSAFVFLPAGSLGEEHHPHPTSDYSIRLSVSLQSRPPASAQRILTPADSVTSTLEDQLSFTSLSRELINFSFIISWNTLECERMCVRVCMCNSGERLSNGQNIDLTPLAKHRARWRQVVLRYRTRAFGRMH